MATKWQGEPKRWRVRGKAADGMTVTLGRYDTEDEAKLDCERFSRQGGYRDLRVDPIHPSGNPSAPSSGR